MAFNVHDVDKITEDRTLDTVVQREKNEKSNGLKSASERNRRK